MLRPRELNMRLLIVDDSDDNCLLLEAILESEGFHNIFVANSARQAMELLFESMRAGKPIDLVLMDLMMPEITGIEAIKMIKADEGLRDVPIIVVTAKSDTKDLVEAFAAGASDYITKPINEYVLMARIASMLRLKSEVNRRKRNEKKLLEVTEKLEENNRKLKNFLARVSSDLEAAGKMQRSLLPSEELKIEGMRFKWFYEPCESIGGDLLNVIPLTERFCSFYLMDVSGHGIQSAILAISVHRMLSAWGGENSILTRVDGSIRNPSSVVSHLNQEFMIQKNNYQYFTMTYGLIDLQKKKLTFCRAGQTPLLIQDEKGEIQIVEKGDPPVGFTDEYKFSEFEVDLKKDNRLILYSDGITEARKNDGHDFFGDKRFFEYVRESRCHNLEEAVPAVIQNLFSWLGDHKPADDITMLAIEIE